MALVLHTHLPYLADHGVWPVGEEWLFQAWGESWLPVTDLLLRLAEDGMRDVLTLGVSPLVAEQVADRRLRAEMGTWLAGQMWRGEEQRAVRYGLPVAVRDLGRFYWRRYAWLLEVHERIEGLGGLLAVWADLARRGVVELLGGPATHPYLPLQTDGGLVDAQLACGLEHHAGWAGARPTGIWVPEMGYRPRGQVADATATPDHVDAHGTPTLPRGGPELPGLEEAYAARGVDHFLVDAPTLVRAAGGAGREWTVRPEVPAAGADPAYEVVHDGVLVGESDVVAFARDLSVAYHVWSPTAGYPGNVWYRDFFARGDFGVHPSWRVTDKALPADAKAPYEPDRARRQAHRDAAHLQGVLRDVLDPRRGELVVAAYDTELFGHWWFEGVTWLESLLRGIDADQALTTTTLAGRLARRPPRRRLELAESSWGFAKGHASWVTDATRWMWQGLRDAERRARTALRTGRGTAPVRTQLAREVALLACSDWPFMVARGKAPDYATGRFHDHAARVHELAAAIEGAGIDADRLTALARSDRAPGDPMAILAALQGVDVSEGSAARR